MSGQKRISQNWEGTSDIVIIPINADGKPETQRYIDQLNNRVFQEIPHYFDNQVHRYLKNRKHIISVQLGEPTQVTPPTPPSNTQNKFAVALWSLKLRWWMWNNRPKDYHSQQIRLYTLYSSPAERVLLPHSTGLQKGLVGIIHARAKRNKQSFNNLIIAHELLHIYGASDKYNLQTGKATYPHGYADLAKKSTDPQRYAALMGRTIPITKDHHKVAIRLSQTRVNAITAKEIGWLK